ncbi:MAG: hypothetical protein ACREIP_03175, partial [Alphaproteobacteria bacterium]
NSTMKMKPSGRFFFKGLFLLLVTIAPALSGCARLYYGSFRYEAECTDRDPHDPGRSPVCVVERT